MDGTKCNQKITRRKYLLLLQLLLRLLLPLWLVGACEGLLLLNQSDLKKKSLTSRLTQHGCSVVMEMKQQPF